MKQISRISAQEFEILSRDTRVLASDSYGEKVLLTGDGMILKMFRKKRLISTVWLRPYARRFLLNSRRLKTLGIPSVDVKSVYACREMQRHIVVYPMLPGKSLRQALSDGHDRSRILRQLALFIAELHKKGIYFRSLHMGNVLVLPNGTLGLIDIAAMTIKSAELNIWQRIRNFKPVYHYEVDVAHLETFGIAKFITSYIAAANLRPLAKRLLVWNLARFHRRSARHRSRKIDT